ncbi:hypothetical protein MTX20_11150 [Bradyrhizobium sp. ISRA435]|nr:hypothetical protein MTX20_11150 [Bradyrhizobium sp. ISRA435]
MPRATSCSESFFSVAGLSCGPLPSWSVEPEPAIRSATGGFRDAWRDRQHCVDRADADLVSSAAALASEASNSSNVTTARILCC